MSGNKRAGKRKVRFSDVNEVREIVAEADGPPAKRPLVDPMEALEGKISDVCLAEGDGGSGGMDAGAAAAQRAAQRKSQLLAGFEDGAPFLGDIQDAEADYEEPEEMFNDAGVPWEPFHLKREREEGYFDEDGNYVEYKSDAVEDAWADDLANVEVDEEWLARVLGAQGRAGAAGTVEPDAELSPEQIAARKRRVVELLLPGESVLQALRRLARVRQLGAGAGDPTPRPRPASQVMPPSVRERFEELTGLSSALMEAGEYSVHSMTREQLERGIPGGGGSDTGGGRSAAVLDPAPAGMRPAAAGDAGQRLAERLLAAAGASPGGLSGGPAAPPAAAAPPSAADAQQDIFADVPPPGPAQPSSNGPPGSPGPSRAAAADQRTQQQQRPSLAGPAPGRQADASMQGEPERPQQPQSAQPPPQQPAGGSGGFGGAPGLGLPPPNELDGFVLDGATGLMYNSGLGAYYDSARQLFGDAASGLWYSFDAGTGQYQLSG